MQVRKLEALREETLEAPSVREHYTAALVEAANELIEAGGKAVYPPTGLAFTTNPCPTWAGKRPGVVGKPIGKYCHAGGRGGGYRDTDRLRPGAAVCCGAERAAREETVHGARAGAPTTVSGAVATARGGDGAVE